MKHCETCEAPMPDAHPKRRFCTDKCRKVQYHGICEDCGGETDGTASGKAPVTRCRKCQIQFQRDNRKWTRETVIAAMREWEASYGFPPSATDWNLPLARTTCKPETLAVIEKQLAEGDWPQVVTVQREFGSWNNAIVAAGFKTRGPGERNIDRTKVAA